MTTSLAHQWIRCSEWVPSEWESKQLIKGSGLKLNCLNNGFVSYKYAAFHPTRYYLKDWSGVDYCDILSAVWTLILTAPIHCRGPTESKWWNATATYLERASFFGGELFLYCVCCIHLVSGHSGYGRFDLIEVSEGVDYLHDDGASLFLRHQLVLLQIEIEIIPLTELENSAESRTETHSGFLQDF